MTKDLLIQAIVKFFSGIVLVGFLIFAPAGTFSFAEGWLLMGILFIPMFIAGIIMMIKNPELLKKRLKAKEKLEKQSAVVLLSGIMFAAGFIIAGLGVRFGWCLLPKGVIIGATVLFLLAYLLYGEVLRENVYLGRTIEVEEGQKVIDVGLYSVVRHPMYTSTILMFLSVPLVLGSIYSFSIFLIYPFLIAVRIKSEEEFLEKELKGYTEYKKKVKYRLLPFIW